MNLTRKLSVICAISLISVIMYSAPNSHIYAAGAGNDGVSSHTPAPKGIHASISTPININNGRWNEFSFRGIADPTWGCAPVDVTSPLSCTPSSGSNSNFVDSPTWTVNVPTNAHAKLTVTDAFYKGDNFNVLDGGSSIGTTSSVATDLTATSSDPAVTSLTPTWSTGTFTLGAGPHSLNIKTVSGSVDSFGGAAYFKVDIACDSGYIKGVSTTSTDLICVHIDNPINPTPVGGMGIPIDSTALLLAGVQGSALWMIPAIVIAGAGLGLASFKRSKRSVKKD